MTEYSSPSKYETYMGVGVVLLSIASILYNLRKKGRK